MSRSISSTALFWCAAAALAVGGWRAVDHPEAGGDTCAAPWDVVRDRAAGAAQACRDATQVQLIEVVAVVVAGLALLAAAVVVRRREAQGAPPRPPAG